MAVPDSWSFVMKNESAKNLIKRHKEIWDCERWCSNQLYRQCESRLLIWPGLEYVCTVFGKQRRSSGEPTSFSQYRYTGRGRDTEHIGGPPVTNQAFRRLRVRPAFQLASIIYSCLPMKSVSRQEIHTRCTITPCLYCRDGVSLMQVSGNIGTGETFSSYKGVDFIA